jgi:hypothetical protein
LGFSRNLGDPCVSARVRAVPLSEVNSKGGREGHVGVGMP